MKLKIYRILEEYIEYLRKYDNKNIKTNKGEKIIKNAKKLYEKVTIYNSEFFIEKCAKFTILEAKCLKYRNKKNLSNK